MNLQTGIEVLERLVAFDTVSSNSNRELIDWVANYLDGFGVTALVQHGDEPGKANLYATIGPQDRRGVLLSGHSDVVPVAGEVWSSDPFKLTQRNGNLHGRGSADMKAFIACFTAMAPAFQRAGLKTPVHLALSYNEETNMHGMKQLARHFESAPVKPAVCIIGEPTSMRVVVANKGAAIYRVKVRGKALHSSLRDQGVSAVEVAAEIIVFINAIQRRLNQAERHDGFEFPHTSVHVGRINGGTAHNITARDCEFVFEIRALPGTLSGTVLRQIQDHCTKTLLPAIRAVSPDCDIVIEEITDVPPLDDRGNTYLAQAVMPLCGGGTPGRVSFGTEAGILQAAGVQTIVCGPGQIKVAHQPDEYVEIEQLDRCMQFLERLNGRLAAGTWPE